MNLFILFCSKKNKEATENVKPAHGQEEAQNISKTEENQIIRQNTGEEGKTRLCGEGMAAFVGLQPDAASKKANWFQVILASSC